MKLLCMVLVAAIMTGCDIVGTVIDISGSETSVRNMRLSGSGVLHVITGGTLQTIPLESFESIVLYPEEARIVNGQFCFLADVAMRDGTRLPARDKAHENVPITFVSVNQTLSGTSHRGAFSAALTGVTKISIMH